MFASRSRSSRRREAAAEDRKNVQAIVEILTRLPVGIRPLEIAMGRRRHADVDLIISAPTGASNARVFKNAQELGLRLPRGIAHFVEQQRSAVRQFEAPGATLERSGEGAFLVAEELAFDRVSGTPRS